MRKPKLTHKMMEAHRNQQRTWVLSEINALKDDPLPGKDRLWSVFRQALSLRLQTMVLKGRMNYEGCTVYEMEKNTFYRLLNGEDCLIRVDTFLNFLWGIGVIDTELICKIIGVKPEILDEKRRFFL